MKAKPPTINCIANTINNRNEYCNENQRNNIWKSIKLPKLEQWNEHVWPLHHISLVEAHAKCCSIPKSLLSRPKYQTVVGRTKYKSTKESQATKCSRASRIRSKLQQLSLHRRTSSEWSGKEREWRKMNLLVVFNKRWLIFLSNTSRFR